MRDSRFYPIAGTALAILATLSILALNLAGIDRFLITSISVPAIGLLAILVNDIRTASLADARAESVRVELEASNVLVAAHLDEVLARAEQVKATLESATADAAGHAEAVRSELIASNASVAALNARKFVDAAHFAEAMNGIFANSAKAATHEHREAGSSARLQR